MKTVAKVLSQKLVDKAKDGGGSDNITATVIY
jgi:hypothetical protein